MKSALYLVLGLLVLISFPKCTGTSSNVVKCDLEDAFEAGLAYVVETGCGCNATATRTWANGVVDPVNACTASSASVQGNLKGIPLCATLISAVSASAAGAASGLCNNLVPNGQCNPTANVAFLANAVTTLCSGVLSAATGGIVTKTK